MPATGVRGAPVRSLETEGLSCIYSPLIPPQEFSQDDALRFHAVIKTVFDQKGIIPFRFPTILQNETELQEHLRTKYDVYSSELQRLKDAVQMELRITAKIEAASGQSGTDYLRSKQQHSQSLQVAAQQAQSALANLMLEWKERPMDQGLRCYALVRRSDMGEFRRKLEQSNVGGSAKLFLSGPWPATEFLHD
jgi:gas vesicle protein GvpL/GvpF